jgi:hypothetical protein
LQDQYGESIPAQQQPPPLHQTSHFRAATGQDEGPSSNEGEERNAFVFNSSQNENPYENNMGEPEYEQEEYGDEDGNEQQQFIS